jgi:Tol biopolymer transport system component
MTRSLAAGLGTLALLVAPAAAAAHPTSTDGRIVWSRFTGDSSGTARIVSARPDGSALRVLSSGAAGEQDFFPSSSPDGRRVVFERDTADGIALVVVNADGTHQRTLSLGCVDPCDSDQIPGWTPDGNHITFTRVVGPFDAVNESARSAVLHVADLDGSHVHRLSQPGIDGAYEDYYARFVPGRPTVTFARVRDADPTSAIFAMDVRTRRSRQLTPWELAAEHPAPSSRGVVAFETFGHGTPEGKSQDVATVPVDCGSLAACTSRIRYVTHNGAGPTASAWPAWSPDGRRLAFAEWSDTTPADIWTAKPHGSDRRQVSTWPLWDFMPSWGVSYPDPVPPARMGS